MLDQQAKPLPELLSKQGEMRLISQGYLVFRSNRAIDEVLISCGILQQKDLTEIYRLPETEAAGILEKLLDDYKKLDSEEALEIRNFCLGVTALELSYNADIRKERLKLLTGFFPNVQKITIGEGTKLI